MAIKNVESYKYENLIRLFNITKMEEIKKILHEIVSSCLYKLNTDNQMLSISGFLALE